MTPLTKYIERNGSRLIISEHESECFIATEKPMFLDPDQCEEAGLMLYRLGRKMKRKK